MMRLFFSYALFQFFSFLFRVVLRLTGIIKPWFECRSGEVGEIFRSHVFKNLARWVKVYNLFIIVVTFSLQTSLSLAAALAVPQSHHSACLRSLPLSASRSFLFSPLLSFSLAARRFFTTKRHVRSSFIAVFLSHH